jgi:hypothetical protein
MEMTLSEPSSLYLELAERPIGARLPGRTDSTKAKETIDNDVEGLLLESLVLAPSDMSRGSLASLYGALAESAPAAVNERGQTRITATKETIDNDQERIWLELLDGN